MIRTVFLAAVTCTFAAVGFTGCVTSSQGVSDEELIAQTVEAWKTALVAHDLENVMAAFSDEFAHYQAPDKATLEEMLGQAFEMGMGDDIAVDLEGAETQIEGDRATVGPIELTTAIGSITGDLVLAKEKDGWLIVTIDVVGF